MPAAAVDLRLAGDELHDEAGRVPNDDEDTPRYIGAHAPDTDDRCVLRDPLPPADRVPARRPEPGPFVDYRALMPAASTRSMVDRSRRVLPGWSEAGPADQTTMLFELLANRMDHLWHCQEVAVAEGFVGTALQRRSVEDHARLVDYRPDSGLSATTMIRFDLDDAGIAALVSISSCRTSSSS